MLKLIKLFESGTSSALRKVEWCIPSSCWVKTPWLIPLLFSESYTCSEFCYIWQGDSFLMDLQNKSTISLLMTRLMDQCTFGIVSCLIMVATWWNYQFPRPTATGADGDIGFNLSLCFPHSLRTQIPAIAEARTLTENVEFHDNPKI